MNIYYGKKIAVLGGEGFIGGHLVDRLISYGSIVTSIDKNNNFYWDNNRLVFNGDLCDQNFVNYLNLSNYDYIFQLAADMGGAGFIFSGDHDSDIMSNSALINLNVLNSVKLNKNIKIFYSSSACIYPSYNQQNPDDPKCDELSAYPADPDSEYGWEKLFSERLYLAFRKNNGINTYIARFHNIYGPKGAYDGGREKAPAAICRKVFLCKDSIDLWGSGKQTRSFLYIDDCIDATLKLVSDSNFYGPVNIGSEEMVTIDKLANLIISISGKSKIKINHIDGPIGVMGRNSDNNLIKDKLGWAPKYSLKEGLEKTYQWISSQLK